MFVPYNTNAPLHHYPIATIGLITASIALYVASWFDLLFGVQLWMLQYAGSLQPLQWLTSLLLNGTLLQLLWNVIFLWVFGLIVEGKLGWWRFLLCCLVFSGVQALLEQLLLSTLVIVPSALGSSAIVFGLMAMAIIWAPENDVYCVWILYYHPWWFEYPVWGLAAFYVFLELVFLGFGFTESWLTLSGFLVGLPLGILLLKKGLVDCEGWDIFHVLKGDYGGFKEVPTEEEVEEQLKPLKEKKAQQELADCRATLAVHLKNGNGRPALALYKKARDQGLALELDRNELLRMIKALDAEQMQAEEAPFLAELIERFPDGADPARIKLAELCVTHLDRPGKALGLLKAVRARELSEAHLKHAKRIAARARQLQAEGTLELDSDAW